MADDIKIDEEQPSQTPAEKPELTPDVKVETPEEPEVNPLEEQNKQLFARAKKAEEKEKELQAQIEDLQSQQVPSDYGFGDEDTKKEIDALKNQIAGIQEKAELDALYAKEPVLKDKAEEFDEFRKEYPRTKLENIAKLFKVEQGLTDEPVREGLEKPTGGTRVPPSTGKMSSEDAKRLRETNYEGYRQALKEGKIDLEK